MSGLSGWSKVTGGSALACADVVESADSNGSDGKRAKENADRMSC